MGDAAGSRRLKLPSRSSWLPCRQAGQRAAQNDSTLPSFGNREQLSSPTHTQTPPLPAHLHTLGLQERNCLGRAQSSAAAAHVKLHRRKCRDQAAPGVGEAPAGMVTRLPASRNSRYATHAPSVSCNERRRHQAGTQQPAHQPTGPAAMPAATRAVHPSWPHLHHFNHGAGAGLEVVAARVKGQALAHNGHLLLHLACSHETGTSRRLSRVYRVVGWAGNCFERRPLPTKSAA